MIGAISGETVSVQLIEQNGISQTMVMLAVLGLILTVIMLVSIKDKKLRKVKGCSKEVRQLFSDLLFVA